MSALLQRHLNECRGVAINQALRARRALWLLGGFGIALPLVVCVLLISQNYGTHGSRMHMADFALVLLKWILGLLSLGGLRLMWSMAFAGLERRRRWTKVVCGSSPIIEHMVADLSRHLALEPTPMIVELRRSNRVIPSVAISGGTHCVLIPNGFHVVMARYPDRARAMMCHELAHIAHGDVSLWVISEHFRDVFWFIPTILFVAGFFAGVGDAGVGNYFIGASVICWVLSKIAKAELSDARDMSERLADLSAAIHSDPKALVDALCAYLPLDHKPSVSHPAVFERVAHVRN